MVCFTGVVFGRDELSWHGKGGQVTKGVFDSVLGPYALISEDDSLRFIPIESLLPDELDRVAAITGGTQNERKKWDNAVGALTKELRENLVHLESGKAVSFNPASETEPEYYLLYYSAAWCGPCHRYTPSLVKKYAELKAELGDRVELIFVSDDENKGAQEKYMKEFEMPWPALKYYVRKEVHAVEEWRGDGIPCLVLVNKDGRLIFHSYHGADYVGPDDVLKRLDSIKGLIKYPDAPFPGTERLVVRRYIRGHAGKDITAKAYFCPMNLERYKGLKLGTIKATCNVDDEGNVKSVDFDENTPDAIRYILSEDLAHWKFLPSLTAGNPIASRVVVPMSFKAK